MVLKNDWQDADDFYAADANDVASEVNSLAGALDTKVGTGRLVTSGTGLTGGGDLSTDRTLAVDFGATAGKVCEGNDSRLSDARPPTAHSHGTSGLDDDAVTTAKIGDGQVTAAKLGTGAVTTAKIGGGQVTAVKLATDVQATLVQPRVTATASAGTLTINCDTTDQANLTAQAAALTVAAPTGSKTSGRKLMIRVKDNGTARAITWNGAFTAGATELPNTTTVGKTLIIGVMWDEAASKWVCLAKDEY